MKKSTTRSSVTINRSLFTSTHKEVRTPKNLLLATVSKFFSSRDRMYGFAVAQKTKETFHIHQDKARKIIKGTHGPVLSNERTERWPTMDEEIVLKPFETKHPDQQYRSAHSWGYWYFYNQAVQEATVNLQIYRVIAENYFMGELMSGRARHEEVFVGTADEMQKFAPIYRGNDRFAEKYHSGPITAIQHFEKLAGLKKSGAEIWVKCDEDPRLRLFSNFKQHGNRLEETAA